MGQEPRASTHTELSVMKVMSGVFLPEHLRLTEATLVHLEALQACTTCNAWIYRLAQKSCNPTTDAVKPHPS